MCSGIAAVKLLIICPAQAVDQAVKIVIAVKFDFNLAFLAVFFDHDLGAEVTGEIFCEVV
jgi:hypothetical protein